MNNSVDIASIVETGALGIKHLKRFWSASIASQGGGKAERENKWQTDRLLLDALGLGIHQTIQYLFRDTPDFYTFERWIVNTAGKTDSIVIERFNAAIVNESMPVSVCEWLNEIENSTAVFSDDDLVFWEENGYVIVRDAAASREREAAEAAIWEYAGANPLEPDSWYQTASHGIMLELVQHPDLAGNPPFNAHSQGFFTTLGYG